jgi:hypothetical protein
LHLVFADDSAFAPGRQWRFDLNTAGSNETSRS